MQRMSRVFSRWTQGLAGSALVLGLVSTLVGCNNSPYPEGAAEQNTIYTAFNERSPRYLDPTSSYSSNETPYTYQIYEPLYG